MEWLDRLIEKWNNFWDKSQPFREKTGKTMKKIGSDLSTLGKYIFKLRGLLLSIPVAAAAIVLSIISKNELPETVEVVLPMIDTQSPDAVFGFLVSTTEYIPNSTAIIAPLVLTAACLLLTICSKRTLYPWIISIFTLTVPLFLILTNVYL